MLQVFSDVEYNIPGDTYFAELDDAYLVAYVDYDRASAAYEVSLFEELGAGDGRVQAVDTTYYADTYEEAQALLDAYKSNLDVLAISGRLSRYSLLEAWEEL